MKDSGMQIDSTNELVGLIKLTIPRLRRNSTTLRQLLRVQALEYRSFLAKSLEHLMLSSLTGSLHIKTTIFLRESSSYTL
jgi:hypothetical protein